MCCYASLSPKHHINQNKIAHGKVAFFIPTGNFERVKASWNIHEVKVLFSKHTMPGFLLVLSHWCLYHFLHHCTFWGFLIQKFCSSCIHWTTADEHIHPLKNLDHIILGKKKKCTIMFWRLKQTNQNKPQTQNLTKSAGRTNSET